MAHVSKSQQCLSQRFPAEATSKRKDDADLYKHHKLGLNKKVQGQKCIILLPPMINKFIPAKLISIETLRISEFLHLSVAFLV